MNSKTYIILGLGIILLLGYAYAENETKNSEDTVISFLNETTVEIVTTTTTATTSTSMESTTTTSTKDTTSTTKKSTTTTTTQPKTTAAKKKTCNSYCKNIGYEGGDCRLNGLECRVRNEVKSIYGGRLCPTARLDTCCCQTDKSVELDSKYSYTINTPIEPLLNKSVTKTVKTSTTDNIVPTAKGETVAKLQEFIEADLEGE
jgi:hypothetical protein